MKTVIRAVKEAKLPRRRTKWHNLLRIITNNCIPKAAERVQTSALPI